MPPKCTICTHPKRAEIDASILTPGASLRSVAQKFGVSADALGRHQRNGHIMRVVKQAAEIRAVKETREEVAIGETLLGKMDTLLATANRLLASAEAQDDLRAAAPLLGQVRQTLESIAKIRGDLPGDGTTVNVAIVHQQYNDMRSIVQEVMCPECRRRLAERLKSADP